MRMQPYLYHHEINTLKSSRVHPDKPPPWGFGTFGDPSPVVEQERRIWRPYKWYFLASLSVLLHYLTKVGCSANTSNGRK